MNRFLTRKHKDGNAPKDKKPKKGKKGQPEPEPVLDLTTALPSTDDFRTSLIMPSLSTRFSMLREQDDPNSKLGKASDDSVLHPKRQSRLHEFGFNPAGLSDIAEVASLSGSARRAFGDDVKNSMDGRPSEDAGGSVMTRARPGEGNNLFGGRQKIYKISNTGSTGRLLYDDDVHLSAFQRLRLEEKERLRQQDAELHSEPSSPVHETDSALPDYSRKRETTSSTNSGNPNARSSTAATSISSQGTNSISASSPSLPSSATTTAPAEMARSGTKTRRLYEQALDQQMQEQQSSAINRLNSLQKKRAPTGTSTPPLGFSQTLSATNLSDRFNRMAPANSKDAHSNSSSPAVSRAQSPPLTTPLASDSDEAHILNSALQPNDKGKATAMGAFNKPTQAFSEQQYEERLKQLQQLQQDREPPAPKPGNPRKPSLRERAELARQRSNSAGKKDTSASAPLQPRTDPTDKVDTSTSACESPKAKAVENSTKASTAFSVFERAAALMKNQSTTPSTPCPALSPPKTAKQPSADEQSSKTQKGGTFFASPGSSDDEDEAPQPAVGRPSDVERRPYNLPTANGPAPPILDHPAMRSRSNTLAGDSDHPALRSRSNSRPSQPYVPEQRPSPQDAPKINTTPSKPQENDVDSPTLGPTTGGLGGLIRQHLRNVSAVSSEWDDDNRSAMTPAPLAMSDNLSLQTQKAGLQPPEDASETNTAMHSGYSQSSPWDLDDLSTFGDESVRSVSPVDANKPKMQHPNAMGMLSSTQAVNDTIREWEKEMKQAHKREPSLEEREAFQRELALRQRAIQESLQNSVPKPGSRNASPAPSGGLKNALSMLRAKSSKESFATLGETKPTDGIKPVRKPGLGDNSANASSTSLAGPYAGDHWRSEERFGPRDAPRQKPMRILQQSEQDAQRELENRQRSATNDSNRDAMANGRHPRASTSSSSRGRSSSEVSNGRSRSRGRHYRDDLEQAMNEGSRSTYSVNSGPSVAGYAANTTPPLAPDRPSLESQGRMRSRSNSKLVASTHYEGKHLQPIQTHHTNGSSPHLTPAANSPMHPSPGMSPRPSPGAPSPSMNSHRSQGSPFPPYSAHNSPPASGASTPLGPAINSGAAAIMPSGPSLRKKSINKADISDPIFLSTTSVIDTVTLPSGASLKNGTQSPPPVPPINPMRRRFALGRSGTDESSGPYTDSMYTNSSDTLSSKPSRGKLRKSSSESKSLHTKSQVMEGPSPAMPPMPYGRNGSPPRPINANPIHQQNMDGAMF